MKYRHSKNIQKQRNTPALVKFCLLALAVCLVGFALSFGVNKLVALGNDSGKVSDTAQADRPGDTSEQEDQGVSILDSLGSMIAVVTLLAALAVLFFGFRAYMTGVKVHHQAKKPGQRIGPH